MSKLPLSLACLLLMAGLALSNEYTIISYDKGRKVLILKDKAGKEMECQLSERTKVTRVKKDGTKIEEDVTRREKMLSSGDAAGKKIDATVEKGQVTEITAKRGKTAMP